MLINHPINLVPYFWGLSRWWGRNTSMSLARLQEFYRPPEFFIAARYAAVVRSFGLALLYGPLGPVAYWLASASMLISYLSTKFAIMHYYRHPPRMSDELTEGRVT